MNTTRITSTLVVVLLFWGVSAGIAADDLLHMPDARMLRFPDVSAEQIVFVYAGDLWTVPKTGGTARSRPTAR